MMQVQTSDLLLLVEEAELASQNQMMSYEYNEVTSKSDAHI